MRQSIAAPGASRSAFQRTNNNATRMWRFLNSWRPAAESNHRTRIFKTGVLNFIHSPLPQGRLPDDTLTLAPQFRYPFDAE
jgi:hypothetical protein